MLAPPLQVIDSFLLNYNLGDVLILVTVLGALGLVAQRQDKLLSVHFLTFGLLFLILPKGMFEPAAGSVFTDVQLYKFVGLALLVVAPVLYSVSRR